MLLSIKKSLITRSFLATFQNSRHEKTDQTDQGCKWWQKQIYYDHVVFCVVCCSRTPSDMIFVTSSKIVQNQRANNSFRRQKCKNNYPARWIKLHKRLKVCKYYPRRCKGNTQEKLFERGGLFLHFTLFCRELCAFG